eukprot:4800224-Prorocentrum_lima.AAC.1
MVCRMGRATRVSAGGRSVGRCWCKCQSDRGCVCRCAKQGVTLCAMTKTWSPGFSMTHYSLQEAVVGSMGSQEASDH